MTAVGFSLPGPWWALGLDRWETYHALPNKLVCAYSSGGESTAKNLFIFGSPELSYDYRDVDRQKKILADAFAGDGWEIPAMLENAAAARDFYFDSITLIEMDRWSKGRVVLLGDAAHCASPASGQGTGLALIGAYILAGELAAANGDHTPAYERYESGMRPGVELNQKFAERFAKEMTVPSKGKIRLRMAMMRILPYMPWKNLIARKITEGVQEAAYAIGIKDYASREALAAAR